MGRRGPKRKAVTRQPNGQPSRSKAALDTRAKLAREGLDREQQDMIAVGIEARQRVFGLPVTVSRDQMAGCAVGRYCLLGGKDGITRLQYDAAMLYLADCEAYSRAIATPGIPRAVDLNATGGQNHHENVGKVLATIRSHEAMVKAVQSAQNELRNTANLFGALDAVIRRDVMLDHLLGDLRTALNALVRHYGIDGRAAA